MLLFFIRHAQSVNNEIWDNTGGPEGREDDPDITALGRLQAQALASYLANPTNEPTYMDFNTHNRAGYPITHLYTSLMLRALETASVVSEKMGIPMIGWDQIHERGGIYLFNEETEEKDGLPGMRPSEMRERYPTLILPEGLDEKGWWNRPGEERQDWEVRAVRVLEKLVEVHGGTDDRVAMVSHGGFFNSIMRTLLRIPPQERDGGDAGFRYWIDLSNTSISRIELGEEMFRITYVNKVDHLPTELIS